MFVQNLKMKMEDIEEVICAEGSYPPAIIGQKVNILGEICIKQHIISCVFGFVSQTHPFAKLSSSCSSSQI